MQLSRIEAECVVAFAVSTILGARYAIRESLVNIGPEIMKKCPKCGRLYFADCIDCTFRNGGALPESDPEEPEPDLVEQMNSLTSDPGYNLENALQWMGVQQS